MGVPGTPEHDRLLQPCNAESWRAHLLVGVRLGGVDGHREVGGGQPARLLALGPVQLLLDRLLGEAAARGGSPRPTGSCPGCRTGRRPCRPAPGRAPSRTGATIVSTRPVRPVQSAFVGSSGRDTVGMNVTGYSPVVSQPSSDVAVPEVAHVRHAVEEDGAPRPPIGEGLAHHRDERRVAGPGADEQVDPVVVGLRGRTCPSARSSASGGRPAARHSSGVNVPPWTSRM